MDTKESLMRDIIDRVRLGVNYYDERTPRNWMSMGRLLSKLDALDNTYRIVGGPKDGERIAIQPGRSCIYMAAQPIGPPTMRFGVNYYDMGYETLTYNLRTNRRTGERALVLEGLEGW